MSSGIPSMFKTPKNKTFDYKPWFYDEQKERKEELERMAEEYKTGNISDERRIERLRNNLGNQRSTGNRSLLTKAGYARTFRLVLIFAIMAGLVWLIFNLE
mgnify:CR=1 FL=1